MTYAYITVVTIVIHFTRGELLAAETCLASKPYVEVIPEADVVIGLVINIHNPGGGVYGCGAPNDEALIMYEATKWCVSVLNQERGLINGHSVTDSFIPGVKIGLRVYDSCSHQDLSVYQLTDLFPIIKSGSSTCSFATNSSILVLGVVDQTSVSTLPRIDESFLDHHLSKVELQPNYLSPTYLAKVLTNVATFLRWEKIAVVYQDDNYSKTVVELLSESLCIASKTLLSQEGSSKYKKNIAYLSTIHRKNTGAVVIAQGDLLNKLIMAMGEAKDAASRMQWLFSWVPPLEWVPALTGIDNVYSLAPHPTESTELEAYWSRLTDPAGYLTDNETTWFREYMNRRSRCESCQSKADTKLEVLYRTSRMLSAFNAVYTMAYNLRSVWRDKCDGLRGLCEAVHQMGRQEFLVSYLQSTTFHHASIDRSPVGLEGYQNADGYLGKIEGGKVTLGSYHIDEDGIPHYRPIALCEDTAITPIDSDFRSVPSPCPSVGCSDCVRNRQGRINADSQPLKDGITTLGTPDDLFFVILLPLHYPGKNPLECSSDIRMEAVEELEAVLWTIDLINANGSYLPGMKVGAVIIDTCSSPLRLTHQVVTYLSDKTEFGRPLKLESVVGVVSAINPDEMLAASVVLSPLNITSISVKDVGKKQDSYSLQVPSGASSLASALTDVLNHIGWNYIISIYDHENIQRYAIFREECQKHSICLAVEHQTEEENLMSKLSAARSQGARVVVLWTNSLSSRTILESIPNDTDFIWITVGAWIHHPREQAWLAREDILSGKLFAFSAKEGSIAKFTSHFEHLTPEKTRNPWFSEYWSTRNCSDGGCWPTSNSLASVIRAVNSLASGLNYLLSEACRTERGLCPTLRRHRQLRQLLNLYTRRRFSRIDDDKDFFGYTSDGSGDAPIDIYRVERMNDIWPYFRKVGNYHHGLKSFVGMSLESGEEITSECTSQCFLCPGRKLDYLITEGHPDLYIAASLTIHGPSENPLECGTLLGMQETEAFLWAVDQVNGNSDLLPGVKIGAIVIDTCGSREKTSRDVGNLFSHYSNQMVLSVSGKIVGFVAAQSPNLLGPVTDITSPLSIPTIAPTVTGNSDEEESRYVIPTGLDHSSVVQCLMDILKLYQWSYVSVIYSDDQQSRIFDLLKAHLEEGNVRIALVEKLDKQYASKGDAATDNILRKLVAKAEKGSRLCFLLLSESHADTFLQRGAYWIQRGLYQPGDIQWLMIDNLEIMKKYPSISAGMLVITPTLQPANEFMDYFQSLGIANNSRNPWFKEYWSNVHNCRGRACYSGLKDYSRRDYHQSPLVSYIIQGVFILSHGLDSLKKLVCPTEEQTPCSEMFSPEAGRLLYSLCVNSAKHEDDTKQSQLVIINIQRRQNNTVEFKEVGMFSEKNGLTLDTNESKTYNSSGSEIEIKSISSAYIGEEKDSRSLWKRSIYTESWPQKTWVIQFMLPIHVPNTLFTCGKIDKESFQTLAGIFNSLYETNRGMMEEKTVGGIVFDTCGQGQRAQEQIFHFFDSEEDKMYNTSPKNVIAVVVFGEETSSGISSILESMNIAQVYIPSFFITKSSAEFKHSFVQSHALVVSDVVRRFGWNRICVLYSSTEKAQEVYEEFKKSTSGPCIAKSIMLHPGDNADHIASILKDKLGHVSPDAAVLFLDDVHLTRNVIWAAKENNLLNKMVWLEAEGWADHPLIQELLSPLVRFLAVRVSNPAIPGFKESYARYTPSRQGNIPKDWFEEMWQSEFHCRLNGSRDSNSMYAVPCSGDETIIAPDVKQSRRVSEVSRAVEEISIGLKEFLVNHCNVSHRINDLDDCGTNSRKLLSEEINKSITTVISYDVMELQVEERGLFYKKVGNWSIGELTLNSTANKYGTCLKECVPCGRNTMANSSGSSLFEVLPLFNSIRTLPNIIFTALSSLGIVLVTICALYFLAVFPISVGTTVLGYTILVGLLILYASNFVFIMEPIPITCGLRRFVMGFAYSIIYAGMLVKLMNTWRMVDYHGNGMTEDYSRPSGSSGLLILALGLVTIQVILMVSWLVLMPPKVVVHDAKWKCVPSDTFEMELLVSHTYVFLLLFVAVLFGIVTRRSNDNQNEARWILGACLLSAAIWIAWPLTIMYVPSHYRHHVIVSANLLSASCVMVCLYLRKAYIYGQLNKKATDQEIKARLHPNGIGATYGTSIHQRETVTRGIQVRRTGRFEGEDGIGTLQVQVADLYPLDMYDGGTPFPPPGRWSTHRRR